MYEEEIKNITKTIKVRRIELGYSQTYMAGHLSISQNMYSKIELNKTQITACKFLMICDLLEINAGELLNACKKALI